jgi:ABC-type multidrug transport system fused ATPase/permease subunit
MTGAAERAEAAIAEQYTEHAQVEAELAERAGKRASQIGYLRLLVFVALLLALLWLVTTPAPNRLLAAVASLAAIGVFAALVRSHERARTARWRHESARDYHELGARRVLRDWDALPPAPPPSRSGEPDVSPAHPYAMDLDIVGRASLIQLLDVTSRAPGRTTLLGWLLQRAPSATEIRERQEAARELAARDRERVELGVLARMSVGVSPRTLERFVEWCETPGWLVERKGAALLWTARLLTLATIVGLLLQIGSVITRPLWALTASLGIFLLVAARSSVSRAVRLAEVPSATLRHHAAMFRLLRDAKWESARLRRIRSSLSLEPGGRAGEGGDADAARQFARLERIMAFAEVRHSSMLHLLLQWLFVWDIHVAASLEAWRRDAGVHVRQWLASLGEAESLAALGTLSHDNPGWTFPVITEGEEETGEENVVGRGSGAVEEHGEPDKAGPMVEATALGHPLLAERVRVSNDVSVGPPGSFLLVTGSNMSGKSTLLRAIGANVVLALAGAPVCAAHFRTPLLSVYTSIRIQDSLERGISLFMAELHRLKAVVDAAQGAPSDARVLFLLDEILHGTNTAERQIAARMVIGRLIRAGAIGAVTTHDLSLAAGGELVSTGRPVHFSEQFDRSGDRTVMTFDYQLRPGLATSANALALLELVGLGAEKPTVR